MSFQVFFAVTILTVLYLRSKQLLTNTITNAHMRDISLLFFRFHRILCLHRIRSVFPDLLRQLSQKVFCRYYNRLRWWI